MDESIETIETRAASLVEDHVRLLRGLVKHRNDHKLSQDVIAERMGVSQPTVASFERYDANPTLATIRRYALAVGARLETHVVDDCSSHTDSAVSHGRSASKRGFTWPGTKSRHDQPLNNNAMIDLVIAGRQR